LRAAFFCIGLGSVGKVWRGMHKALGSISSTVMIIKLKNKNKNHFFIVSTNSGAFLYVISVI
jgi:hypothetical protein